MTACCDITAGSLNRRVEILRRTETTDDMGGVTETWKAVYTPYCKISPTSGSERNYRGGSESQLNYKIAMRFIGDEYDFPAITADDRVKFQNRTFGISYVMDVEDARRFLELGVGAAV